MTTRRKFLQGVGAAVVVPFLPVIPTPENERSLLFEVLESTESVFSRDDYIKYWTAYLNRVRETGIIHDFMVARNPNELGVLDVFVRHVPTINYINLELEFTDNVEI